MSNYKEVMRWKNKNKVYLHERKIANEALQKHVEHFMVALDDTQERFHKETFTRYNAQWKNKCVEFNREFKVARAAKSGFANRLRVLIVENKANDMHVEARMLQRAMNEGWWTRMKIRFEKLIK